MRSLDVARATPERISHLTSKVDVGVPVAAWDDDGDVADVTAFTAQCALTAPGDDPAEWHAATWRRRPDDTGTVRDHADISCGPDGDADWPIEGPGDVDMWAQVTTATEQIVLGPFRLVLT